MAQKKPYEISTASDGITSLTVSGLTEMFRSRKALNSFALQLAEQIQSRRVGMFHLQDTSDGGLTIHFHKTGHVLRCNGYDQAARLAEMLYEETKE